MTDDQYNSIKDRILTLNNRRKKGETISDFTLGCFVGEINGAAFAGGLSITQTKELLDLSGYDYKRYADAVDLWQTSDFEEPDD